MPPLLFMSLFSVVMHIPVFRDVFLLLQGDYLGELSTQIEKALVLKSPYLGQRLSRCLKLLLRFS